MMPKINGLENLKRLKNNPDTESIPVVILTNLSMPEEINRAHTLGAVKFLIKSNYMPQEISQIIKKLLNT
jgi:CheY-like chemotaxis protein